MDAGLNTDEILVITGALAPYDCAVIYLFGSHASGAARPESDIDIAFLASSKVASFTRFHLAGKLSERLRAEVDLVDLSEASTVFAKEVVTKGIPLYVGNETARRTFEMYTYSDYARLNDERRKILTS